MKRTTLCYIEKDGCYLMLRRATSKKDGSAGKYLGVGGKIEQGETVEQCLLREIREETGLSLVSFRERGVVSFFSDLYEDETMYLYTAIPAEGDPPAACDEGELSYIPKEKVPSLPLWEGDRIFLRLLAKDAPFFTLSLYYEGERLTRALLNGTPLPSAMRDGSPIPKSERRKIHDDPEP